MKPSIKKKIFLFVLLSLVGILLGLSIHRDRSVYVSRALSKISQEDREALETFFSELHFSGGAYVLFGNKPLSICLFTKSNYSERAPLTNIIELSTCLYLQNIRANRGLEVWKKHKHLFPSSKFSILENKDENYMTIAIIHKQNFLKMAEENIDIFRKFLGVDITPNIILQRCIASSNFIREVFQNHHVLLGIALGYGRHNAQLFSRKTQIEEEQESFPSDGFSSLEEEYQHIKDLLIPCQEEDLWEWGSLILPLPGFIADLKHPETQLLKKQYREQHKKIIETYKKGDFLEITLEAFMRG